MLATADVVVGACDRVFVNRAARNDASHGARAEAPPKPGTWSARVVSMMTSSTLNRAAAGSGADTMNVAAITDTAATRILIIATGAASR